MKKGFLKIFIFFAFIILFIPNKTYALTFKVEKSVDSAKPNNEVTVYIKASGIGDNSIQNYTVNLTYDSSKLEYKSSSSDSAISSINASSNPIVITQGSGTLSSDSIIATIVFTVKSGASAGDANLTITSSNITNITGSSVSATNTSSLVTIVALSSDATLSSLKIPNATLSPKFDKNTTQYTCDITDITEITINAVATDSNAKIMISDNYTKLVEGENEIKISVTAEDSTTTKTYTITVNLTITPTEEELLKANADLKSLEIEGFDINFSKDLKKYTLTVPYETKKLTILAEAENENATIEMEGNTKLKVGRNTINIVVTSEDTENTNTYVITVTREEEEQEVVQTCPDETSTREWIIFSISMVVIFTLGIVLGFVMCKKDILHKIFKKKEKKKKEDLSDTIKLEPVNDNDKKEKKN